MKTRLMGSASSLEQLRELICKYFYSEITFASRDADTWTIRNSKGDIEGVRVVKKGKRFRFERAEE